MVQIIAEKPSFSQELARGAGKATAAALQGGMEGYVEKKKKQKLDEESETENKSIKEQFGIDLSGIKDPEARKIAMTESLKGQAKSAEMQQKQAAKMQAEEQERQGAREALDWLDDNIKYTGTKVIPGFSSFTGGGLNREAVEKREEYDKTGFWVTDKLYTHFNKGQLTDTKLQNLRENLSPRADLSERENKARVSALRRISNLPRNAPASVIDKEINKEQRALKKIEKRSKAQLLTDTELDSLMEEAGGDLNEADKLGKERGLKW